MTTVTPPSNCSDVTAFWQDYFKNLSESVQKVSEVSFVTETIPAKPSFWQTVLKKIPQAEEITITMKEFDPSRIRINNETISLLSTEEEVRAIREQNLSKMAVSLSYIMTILPKRHKVSFHIGNVTEVKIAC